MHTATYSCPPLQATSSPLTPTPPPTTDRDETFLPTSQDSQRPTDTPPTTTSPNDNGDEIQTSTFEVVTSAVPTTEPVDSNRTSFPVAIAAGIIAAFLALVVIITKTLTVLLAVCMKARKINRATNSMTYNQTYGVALQEENVYTYPRVGQADTTEANRNEAYATNIVTEENEAYATNIVMGGNEAYATNIFPERNEAYKTVTSVTVTEAVDMYDYVKP